MALTTLKRPAEDTLLPLRTHKHPRLIMKRVDGENASPTQSAGILGRWLSGFWKSSNSSEAPSIDVSSSMKESMENSKHQTSSSTSSGDADDPIHIPAEPAPPPPKRRSTTRNSPSFSSRQTPSGQSTLILPSPTTESTSTPTLVGPSSLRLDEALQSSLSKRKQVDHFMNGPRRDYKNKKHIFHNEHKNRVLEDRRAEHERMQREAYQAKRASGYSSDYETFKGYSDYRALLEKTLLIYESRSFHDLPSSAWLGQKDRGRRHSSPDVDSDRIQMERALAKARNTMNEPKPPKPFTPAFQKLWDNRKPAPALAPYPTALTPDQQTNLRTIAKKRGIVSRYAREQVSDSDLARLKPGQWLNDELINFYGALLLGRSDGAKENAAGKSAVVNGKGAATDVSKPLSCWYFSTFFWPKLLKDGYEAGRLAKWTKKFDIFEKDVVLIPINHGNTHWTSAAINFRQKRVESYDSMSMYHGTVFKYLRAYIDAEHRNKKKKPFDFTGWEDHTLEDTPQQENCYDCGVFTCYFLEALSRGEETFRFGQEHMAYLRQRMMLEIGSAQLIDF